MVYAEPLHLPIGNRDLNSRPLARQNPIANRGNLSTLPFGAHGLANLKYSKMKLLVAKKGILCIRFKSLDSSGFSIGLFRISATLSLRSLMFLFIVEDFKA